MVITPERVKSLSLKHLTLRVVFIGFTDEESIEKILEYSNTNHDWIYKKISQEDGGDDSIVKEWLKNEIVKNKKLAPDFCHLSNLKTQTLQNKGFFVF